MNYHLLIIPGNDPRKLLENILGFLITDELAIQFTYKGKASLRSFKELRLCDVIKSIVSTFYLFIIAKSLSNFFYFETETVRKKYPMMEERFFSERIGAWLVYRKREHSAKLQRTTKVPAA